MYLQFFLLNKFQLFYRIMQRTVPDAIVFGQTTEVNQVLLIWSSLPLSPWLNVPCWDCLMLKRVSDDITYYSTTTTMMFRCLRHSVPRYLSDFCTLFTNVAACSQLRSARRHLVVIPRYNRSTYGRRAFSVAGPMTWNSLTDSLRDPSLSIDSFRRQLKTFLFDN